MLIGKVISIMVIVLGGGYCWRGVNILEVVVKVKEKGIEGGGELGGWVEVGFFVLKRK